MDMQTTAKEDEKGVKTEQGTEVPSVGKGSTPPAQSQGPTQTDGKQSGSSSQGPSLMGAGYGLGRAGTPSAGSKTNKAEVGGAGKTRAAPNRHQSDPKVTPE